jgi:hypothetical protein
MDLEGTETAPMLGAEVRSRRTAVFRTVTFRTVAQIATDERVLLEAGLRV